jgi:hypothetical protein
VEEEEATMETDGVYIEEEVTMETDEVYIEDAVSTQLIEEDVFMDTDQTLFIIIDIIQFILYQ